jgi:hypothetical protein
MTSMTKTATVKQLRALRAKAEKAKARHGKNSAQHLTAYHEYVQAAHASTAGVLKSVFVECTS